MESLKSKIRTVPNWPKQGIMFRDITTLIKDKDGLRDSCKQIADHFASKQIDAIAGIEARGFIFGSVIASMLQTGFIPIRKKGKLPSDTISEEYTLEYGTDKIEVHSDAISENEKILIVDDLLATGGTMLAAAKLVEKCKGIVQGCAVVVDLPDLKGREKLKGYDIFSLVEFEGD